jgi:hypothetical protein
MEHQGDHIVEGPIESPTHEVGNANANIRAGSLESAAPGPGRSQSILPEPTQQLLQELADLPARLLPPETVRHLKIAGRETLLAVYSLWQNYNRSVTSDSGEKVRKHIEVE